MSRKHKLWAWARPRKLTLPIAFPLLALLSTHRLHASRAGKLSAENVGYGLAVVGAVLAFIALLAVLFISVDLWPLIYSEILALIGIILLVAGVIVHAAQ
jgi:predicted anti-sigma-YlaC factor YlaD